MARLPYHRGKEIANILRWPKCFYSVMLEILTAGGGLDMVCERLSIGKSRPSSFGKPKPWLIYKTLRHVAYRTLQFGKPIELICHSEIIDGRPDIGITQCQIKPRWLKQILSGLVANNWLVKLTPSSRTETKSSFFGLNFLGWLYAVQRAWIENLENPGCSFEGGAFTELELNQMILKGRPQSLHPFEEQVLAKDKGSFLAKRHLQLLNYSIEFSSPYWGMLNFLVAQEKPIQDWEQFYVELERLRPIRKNITLSGEQYVEKVKNLRARMYNYSYQHEIYGEEKEEEEQEQDFGELY